jgi:predicted nucleotidyltransferase
LIDTGRWQEAAVQHLTNLLQRDAEVLALAIFGSYLQPEALLDAWSDLDLLLILEERALGRYFPAVDWLAPLGTLYAYEQSSNALWHTTRLSFEDLRRIDLVITTDSGLERLHEWSRIPFWAGVQVLFSRSALVDRLLSAGFAPPQRSPIPAVEFEAMASRFWFKGVIAVQKVMRNDPLIALHLALDMVRDCCVLDMMLRDRAEGTSYHREGGAGNRLPAELGFIQQPPTPSGILTMIEGSGAIFDRLAAEWSDAYTARRHPLLAWVKHTRESKFLA